MREAKVRPGSASLRLQNLRGVRIMFFQMRRCELALCLLSLVCYTRVVAGQGLPRSSSSSSSRSSSSSSSSCLASHCRRCALGSKNTCLVLLESCVGCWHIVACGSDCRSCDRAGAGRCDFCNTGFILSGSSAGVCRAQRIATPATPPVQGDGYIL